MATVVDAPPLSLLFRTSLPISHSGGRRMSPAWLDWARLPASHLLRPSALQALGLGPISCQGRGPPPGPPKEPAALASPARRT